MRFTYISFSCLSLLLSIGCATQKQVAQMEGRGTAHVYEAPFDQVWRAAVDAAQIGDLEVKSADRQSGYIATKRGMRLTTHGENVGIWVRPVSPKQTQVEIVSRQAGPPKFWFKDWEDEIFSSIGANLTREIGHHGVLSEPAGAGYYRGENDFVDPRGISSPPPVYQQSH